MKVWLLVYWYERKIMVELKGTKKDIFDMTEELKRKHNIQDNSIKIIEIQNYQDNSEVIKVDFFDLEIKSKTLYDIKLKEIKEK